MNPKTRVVVLSSVGAVLAFLVLGASAGAIGRSSYYAERVLPGTIVAGIDASGMTRAELTSAVEKRLQDVTLDIEVAGKKHELALSDLGVNVDVAATVDAAMSDSASVRERFRFSRNENVSLHADRDQSAYDETVGRLVSSGGTPVVDASVSLAADKSAFIVTPASPGVRVSADCVDEAISTALSSLDDVACTLSVVDTEPTIDTAQAQAVATRANALLERPVSVTDGISVFSASPADKAAWVSIRRDGEKLADPLVDKEKVKAWVSTVASSTNEEARPGRKSVNSRGDVVGVQYPAGKSLRVSNEQEVVDGIVTALSAGREYSGDFDYAEVEPEVQTVTVQDWAKDEVFAPAPGQRWIDIDLTENTVSAYEGRLLVQGPVYIVPGAPGTETITGTYDVYLKYDAQTMRGENLDGSKYETPDVPWVMYFSGGYALHGAYWRSEFGWSGYGGSHGCVNMPVDSAKWFYDWAALGTTVVSHY